MTGEAITASKSHQSLTFVGTGPVNLKNINGGSTGDFLLLDTLDPTKTVAIKSGLGNILLSGGDDEFALTVGKSIMLICKSTGWTELSRSICKPRPVISINGSTALNISIQIMTGNSLNLSNIVSSSSDGTITYEMVPNPNNYVSLSGTTVTAANESGGNDVQITVTQNSTSVYTAASKTFAITTTSLLTNRRSITVDFSSGNNIAIACYESEHITVVNGNNMCVLVNYGGSVYTYASGTLTKISVFPGTAYPVYGGDGITGQGIAIVVESV